MARETVIDRFVTEFLFREDKAAIDRIERRLATVKRRLNAAGNAFAAFGAAATAGLVKSTQKFASFEEAMMLIKANAGATTEQIEAWSGEVRALAKEYGALPTASANALYFINSTAKAGVDTMATLKEVLKAEAVGLGQAETIAKVIGNAQNAYKDTDLSASFILDKLHGSVEKGAAVASDYAQSLGQVLDPANQMGIKFEEIMAFMGVQSRKKSENVPEIATELRGLLSSFMKVTGGQKDFLASIGWTEEGMRDSLRNNGLLNTLNLLNEEIKGDPAAWAELFPNIRALSGAIGVVNSDFGIYQAIMDSQGGLDRAFDTMSGTMQFAINQMKASMDDLWISLGDDGKASVRAMIDAVRAFADAVANANPFVKSLISKALTLGPVALALGGALKVLAFAIGPLVTGMVALWAVMIANPIGLVITAVAALIAIGHLLVTNWDSIKSWLGDIFGAIKAWFLGWELWTLAPIKAVGALATAIYNTLGAAFAWLTEKWDWLTDKFDAIGRFFDFGGDVDGVTAALTPAPAVVQNRAPAVNKTANIQVDNLVVPGANAAEVAENLPGELARQARALADSVDNHFGA